MNETAGSPAKDRRAAPRPQPGARRGEPTLIEVAWEVVNPVGGIYTVIRSKLPAMTERWSRRYCLVGPYMPQTAAIEFAPARLGGSIGKAVERLAEEGIEAHYGTWLVTGRPKVVLLDLGSGYRALSDVRHRLARHHHIHLPEDALLNNVATFGHLVERFLTLLAEQDAHRRPIIAHFHEWMAGTAIPELRRNNVPVSTVFTTHATLLGRYVAANDPWYYDHVPFVNWAADAERFNIKPQVMIERAAAHGSQVFTTGSNTTVFSCKHLLGREVDFVTPNGLNIERFTALHEFQNLHRVHKEKIHEFVMGHFFPSYSFDVDKTQYFFTSGRYEPRNKGFDMTIEALARLNWRMKVAKTDRTVVVFIITRRPTHGLNAELLKGHGVMDELRSTCDAISEQIGQRLFFETARGRKPRIDTLVDEHWRLRLRRTMQAWRTRRLPLIVTHDLVEQDDDIVTNLRRCRLFNAEDDRVKVVYHPDFIDASNPLWGMDYDEFVRGCHLGVFPSYYEPWGYTPLECIARGIPAVSTDVSGFGSYVLENIPEHEDAGIYVLPRRYASFDDASARLAEIMYNHVVLDRRQRIALRNKVDHAAPHFDWSNLVRFYEQAHAMALMRLA